MTVTDRGPGALEVAPRTDSEVPPPSLSTWLGFTLLCVGMFMAILDIQIVVTSLPEIQAALKLDRADMSWLQTSYLIAEVIAIALTGFLTRALSLRWLFTIAIVVFTIASLGCASSTTFGEFVAWRTVQGFAGGVLIPTVFTAIFLMFPRKTQGIATGIAGLVAMTAPTVGPIIGGYITTTYSWPWLFLINLPAGLVAFLFAPRVLPRGIVQISLFKRLDWIALIAIAVALAALEIGLKQAPKRGWTSPEIIALFVVFAALAATFVVRSLRGPHPIADLTLYQRRNYAVGSMISFVLGMGLFGSVYLMPVFLAFVRGHSAFEIGKIMLVTGIAQFVAAPIAVILDRRLDPRILTAFGFTLLAIGIGLSTGQTTSTDFDEMLLPQAVRGFALMFCLVPPTRLALAGLPLERIPDASALFNLMRNLGGAIGLAVIDTIIYTRAPEYGAKLVERLKAGDYAAARELGLPLSQFRKSIGQPIDTATDAFMRPLIEKQSLTVAINDAWMLITVLTALAVVLLLAAHKPPPPAQ